MENKILHKDSIMIGIDKLESHPDNRPLGISREKVDQLKEVISKNGFYSNQSLMVRSVNNHYQIISGEHRFTACKELDFTEIPCTIYEMDDQEALIQLVINNIQSELKPIEIGLNALKVVKKDSKKGYSAAAYGKEIGNIEERTIRNYLYAAEVYQYLREQSESAFRLLIDVSKLKEINKTKNEDWVFLNNFILENNLSFDQTTKICHLIREIDDSIKHDFIKEIIDLKQIKSDVANEFLKEKETTKKATIGIIELIQECYEKLEDKILLYFYNIEKDEIIEQEINLQQKFIDYLKIIGEDEEFNKTFVNKKMKFVLEYEESHTKEAAENSAKYHRDEVNRVILEEKLRIEKEERDAIQKLYLACYSREEIKTKLNIEYERIRQVINEFVVHEEDCYPTDEKDSFKPQIYTQWSFGRATNETKHFGNIPPEIIDNLMYYYTRPLDVIFDPFAGGGSTIDKCKERFRRYYVSDLTPIKGRDDIREWDITKGFPKDMPSPDLIFLDPPYWRQAEEKYSKKETDLANVELDRFLDSIENIAEEAKEIWDKAIVDSNYKLAIIIGLYKNDSKYVDLPFLCYERIKKYLNPLVRIQVPYSTEVHGGAFVDLAKKKKEMLYLTRDLMVFDYERNREIEKGTGDS